MELILIMALFALVDFCLILLTQMVVENFWECPCDSGRPFWTGVVEHIIFPARLNPEAPHEP